MYAGSTFLMATKHLTVKYLCPLASSSVIVYVSREDRAYLQSTASMTSLWVASDVMMFLDDSCACSVATMFHSIFVLELLPMLPLQVNSNVSPAVHTPVLSAKSSTVLSYIALSLSFTSKTSGSDGIAEMEEYVVYD